METFPSQREYTPGEQRRDREHVEDEIDIEGLEEAREAIIKAIERGELPVISVPEHYCESARNGIRAHTTWIGENIIAGTILRPPYLPEGETRGLLRIRVSPEQVEPRFTGPDRHFHGVVVFHGPISPEDIEPVKEE